MSNEKEVIIDKPIVFNGVYGDGYVTDNISTLLDWVVNTTKSAEMQIVTPNDGTYNVYFHYNIEKSTGKYCIDGSSEFQIEILFDIIKEYSTNGVPYTDWMLIDSDKESGNTLDEAIEWFTSSFLQTDSFKILKKIM